MVLSLIFGAVAALGLWPVIAILIFVVLMAFLALVGAGLLLSRFVAAGVVIASILLAYQIVKANVRGGLSFEQTAVGGIFCLFLLLAAPAIADTISGIPLFAAMSSTHGASFASIEGVQLGGTGMGLQNDLLYYLAASRQYLFVGILAGLATLGAYVSIRK